MNRRFFIKSGGVALASISMSLSAPSFLERVAMGQERSRITGGKRKTLVAIFQRGAVDGLNMVVPFGESNYYNVRPSIAIPKPQATNADAAIDLDGFFGLHPSFSSFKPLWDSKRLAIIHAAGSPDNTRSHFDAQDYMESATPGLKSTSDGWLNRYLQTKKDSSTLCFALFHLRKQCRAYSKGRHQRSLSPIFRISQFAQGNRQKTCREVLKRSTRITPAIHWPEWVEKRLKRLTI